MKERVQKILAEAGIASRRKCEQFIKDGKVKVNGLCIKLGDKADKTVDTISLDGKPIKVQQKVYYILNKPKGYISAVSDSFRRTIIKLIKPKERIFPVGRLDFDVEGLLILTNDGQLANLLSHPRYNVPKTYEVVVDRVLSAEDIARLRSLSVDNRKVEVGNIKMNANTLIFSIHEGRKHIVKHMFEILGIPILKLRRVAIGGLLLGNLKVGEYRQVSRDFLVQKVPIVVKPCQTDTFI